MKTTFLILFSFFTPIVWGQKTDDTVSKFKQRNLFSFIPSKVDKVNGLALGVWAENLKSPKDSLKINGVNLEINPVILFVYLGGGFYIPEINNFQNYIEKRSLKINQTDIDGLNISIPGFVNKTSKIRGVNISPLTFCAGEIHGLSISGLTNCSYVMHGVNICGIYNSSNQVKGIQIGLFNRATKLRGLQIGLWNKNEKRSLPFFNWQFKR